MRTRAPRCALLRTAEVVAVALALAGCTFRATPGGADPVDAATHPPTAGGPHEERPAGDRPPGGVPARAGRAEVVSITDGDTLRVRVDGDQEPVRLVGLDAPEIQGGCGAREATEFVRRFVPPRATVWLEADVSDRDRFGRLLRYVWRDDAELLNERLVAAGWAEARRYAPDVGRWSRLQRAQRRAREARAGIWTLCDMPGGAGERPASPADCDPNYTGCVPRYPPDVDCDHVDGAVSVVGDDPHNLDGNRDGRACEGPPA